MGRLPVERFYLEKVIYADPLRGATAAGNFSLLSEVGACGSNKEEPLGRMLELDFTGRRPLGRPKKSWRKIVEADIRLVGASEIDALDRAKWKLQISLKTL